MNKTLLALTLTLHAAFATAQTTQTTSNTTTVLPIPTVVQAAVPSEPISLPDTPELRRVVSLSVPAGGMTLDTALTLIARSAGLTVLTQGLNPVQLRSGLSNLRAGQAITTLLNLYAPGSDATVEGKLLIIGDRSAVARVRGLRAPNEPGRSIRVVRVPGLSGDQLARITPLLTAQSALFDPGVVVLAGTEAQITAASELLRTLPAAPAPAPESRPPALITQTYAAAVDPAQLSSALTDLGVSVKVVGTSLVVRGTSAQQQEAAALIRNLNQLAAGKPSTPRPSTVRRSYESSAVADDAQLITALLDVKVTPLPNIGLLTVEGSDTQQRAVQSILDTQKTRRAGRSISYYAVNTGRASDLISALRRELPDADIQVIEGRNLISVAASAAGQQQAARALARLQDAPLTRAGDEGSDIITRSVKLGYSEAQTVAGTIRTLQAAQTAPQGTATGAAAPQAQGGAPDAATATAPGVSIIADTRTNSLLLTGPRRIVDELSRAISSIDQPEQAVRIRLRVEQLSENDLKNLGINWEVGIGGVTVGQNNGGLSVGYAPSLTPAKLNVALNTARTKGTGRTIIDSNFAALSGQETNFQNGGELLFPATTNTVNGNAVVTPGQTYGYGLEIKVKPRVAPDGNVVMSLDTNLGSTPAAGPLSSVNQTKQSLQSTVMVRPGETVVLGGIVTTTDDRSKKGVPGLMDLPIIGTLFSTTSNTNTRSVLLFVVSAELIESAARTTGAGAERVTLPAAPATPPAAAPATPPTATPATPPAPAPAPTPPTGQRGRRVML